MNLSFFKCNCDTKEIHRKLDFLISTLAQNQSNANRKLEKIMSIEDDILDEARQANTVGDSIIALVEKLVANAGGDPAKLQEALETLKAQRAETEAAILKNTPQDPEEV